jgi:nucleoside-diphosphate-sugar epimerase
VGDIRDKTKLTDAMRGIDIVYHLAAEHSDNLRPVSLYYDVNVGGSENVVYGLRKHGIKKVIFTSSVAVYGTSSEERDECSPIKPSNDYGRSKYEAEVIFNDWASAENGCGLTIVRPTVIFGEKNRGNVYRLLNQITSGRFVMIGNGKNRKSMAYVRNISQFLLKLLNNISGSGVYVYNYADKPDLTIEELVNITFNTLGKRQKAGFRIPLFMGTIFGYAFDLLSIITGKSYPISSVRVKKFCADSVILAEKVKEVGFRAPYSLIDGINKTILYEFSKFI